MKHKRRFLGPWIGGVSTDTGVTLNRPWCNRNKKTKATILYSVQDKKNRRPSDRHNVNSITQRVSFCNAGMSSGELTESSVATKQQGLSLYGVQSHINTFTAIVDLSRSNFSIARAPLFQLKSAT